MFPRLLLCGLFLLLPGGAAGEPGSDSVRIRVDSPKPGAVTRNEVHQAPIRGSAAADGERPAAFDVMIVIDVSGSTRQASGIDVDEDGDVGFNPQLELVEPGLYPPDMQSTDADDSILGAEVKAADALIDSLDPKRVRVGVVSFSGEMDSSTGERMKWNQQDAWLDVPLTSDHARAAAALRGILARGPHGGTNFAAGVRLAVRELAALSGAKSSPRPDAKKVVLFLTDGLPTFPIGLGSVADPGDTEAALAAARLAHKAGVTINTYALGPNALTNPIAATEMARLTLGNFLAVRNPGDIISFLQGVTFANIEDVVFTNLTTREVSTDVDLSPDGSFRGFVPVREGKNRIRVTALASDGSSGSVELDLVFETAGLSARELTLELERIRERNKQLLLLLERERIQKFRESQRKVLEFELEEEAGEEPAP
ncbi:MAG: vWA domain-containing protein [Myxococcota bacterium]|nr:vWA domain-containing protein [Myxococcota bacterium]